MPFHVHYRFNGKNDKVLTVADSLDEFEKITIREVKKKFLSSDPDASGMLNMTLLFRNQTNHVNVLFIYFWWHFRTRVKLQSNYLFISRFFCCFSDL